MKHCTYEKLQRAPPEKRRILKTQFNWGAGSSKFKIKKLTLGVKCGIIINVRKTILRLNRRGNT